MLEVYELAYRLHMPVYKLLNEMPYDEMVGWFEYFKQRPVGWQDDQRTYTLLQAQGIKEKAERIFPSLAAIRKVDSERDKLASTLVSSGFLNKLQQAAHNNGVSWELEIDKN